MSTQSRYDKKAEADRKRRRVRTTKNANRPGGGKPKRRITVTINRPGTKPKRRRSSRSKRPRLRMGGPGTMAWGVISILLCIVALVAQSVLLGVFTAISAGLTAIVNHVESRQPGGGTGQPKRPSKVNKPPGNSTKSKGGGTGGTRGGGSVCGEACKRSPKPKSTCRCRSPKCEHGSMAGAGSGSGGSGGGGSGGGKTFP